MSVVQRFTARAYFLQATLVAGSSLAVTFPFPRKTFLQRLFALPLGGGALRRLSFALFSRLYMHVLKG